MPSLAALGLAALAQLAGAASEADERLDGAWRSWSEGLRVGLWNRRDPGVQGLADRLCAELLEAPFPQDRLPEREQLLVELAGEPCVQHLLLYSPRLLSSVPPLRPVPGQLALYLQGNGAAAQGVQNAWLRTGAQRLAARAGGVALEPLLEELRGLGAVSQWGPTCDAALWLPARERGRVAEFVAEALAQRPLEETPAPACWILAVGHSPRRAELLRRVEGAGPRARTQPWGPVTPSWLAVRVLTARPSELRALLGDRALWEQLQRAPGRSSLDPEYTLLSAVSERPLRERGAVALAVLEAAPRLREPLDWSGRFGLLLAANYDAAARLVATRVRVDASDVGHPERLEEDLDAAVFFLASSALRAELARLPRSEGQAQGALASPRRLTLDASAQKLAQCHEDRACVRAHLGEYGPIALASAVHFLGEAVQSVGASELLERGGAASLLALSSDLPSGVAPWCGLEFALGPFYSSLVARRVLRECR